MSNPPKQRGAETLPFDLRAPVIVSGHTTLLPGAISAGDRLAVYPVKAQVTARGNRSYMLDGVGIFGSRTIVDAVELADVLEPGARNLPFGSVPDTWSAVIKNPSAAFIVDSNENQILCLPDPLGGAIAFRYRANAVTLISTDMPSLANMVDALKLPLQKSAEFQLERLVLGNGGLNASSYENVDRLSPFEYWQVSSKGAERRSYSQSARNLTYVESVHEIRDELIESVLAVAKLPTDQRIAHLTGGFDSRLVLAAAMAGGCAKEFKFFCSGPAGSTDRQIADGLSSTLGLPRSAGAGLTASPLTRVHEQLLAPLYHSGGITSSGPNGGESRSNVVIAGGGYGGILRSTYSSRFRDLSPEEVSPETLMTALTSRPVPAGGIYAEHALADLGNKLHTEWQALQDLGHAYDFIGDAFYLSVRNRYHFGQNSMLWSRVGRRFDPLYSVTAVSAAANLPLYSRQTNVLGFDIMQSFGVDLEKYPFDKNRFTAEYRTLRRAPVELPMKSTKDLKFDNSHKISHTGEVSLPVGLETLAVDSPVIGAAERKSIIATANRIGLNYWHIASLNSAQESLRSGLNQFGLSSAEGLIDTKYAWHLAKGKLTKRNEIRDVYALYGLVAWLGIK